MAIKITTDSIVRVIRPASAKFNLSDLNDHVKGFIEPLKVGPVWVMYSDKAKEDGEPLNKVASFFFDISIYGTALIVSSQQLPADWDIMGPEDYRYTADDIDNGFLLSLQKALINNRVFGASLPNEHIKNLNTRLETLEEWTYKPPPNDSIDENTADFYRQVYNYISINPEQFKKNVLLSEGHLIIKLESAEDKKKIIQQMIDYFVREEEYEKCTVLKKAIEE